MINNKKAVSPLIATVLLVMIVVSIGAAVMVVIQGISEEQIQSTQAQQQLIKCGSDVDIDIIQVDTSYRVCVSEHTASTELVNFSLLLENSGLRDISGWKFTVIGDAGTGVYDNTTQGSALSRGSIQKFNFTFYDVSDGVSDIAKIRLSPQIPGGPNNPVVTCSEPNLEWDSSDIEDMTRCEDVTWDD